ncbi:MmcQ/YjbR family DNA-binding protein [Sandaracinobacteroides saxicola]|uniref:MmcQ/YjbR family DNA-binding protein n=1 Tax=Sandaracinobacteroides saxicola TaxID=2759707 RepID=A0A7G5IFM2_9SPHN|nr:MmcQ/YjbR family DNA-binding protein [Sandaracinobacteroides saxicola]QMW22164.1 MmcQ/YjbR family DNA-binding protein [Sandaracinobacteroides saxicola]
MTWDDIVAIALALPGAVLDRHYGLPAVKVGGRAFLGRGREADSFVLHLDIDTIDMLMATEPESYWQTPHYVGWAAVLARFDSGDPERLAAMIAAAHARAVAMGPPKGGRK